MITIILDILTWFLIGTLILGILFGVAVFFLAVTWMQVNEERNTHEQKKAAQAVIRSASPPKYRRRRPASGYPCEMP